MIIDDTHTPSSGILYETSSKAYELCLPIYDSPPCVTIDTTVLGIQMDILTFSVLSSMLGYHTFTFTWELTKNLEARSWNIFEL